MTGKDREAMLDHLKIEGKEPENRRECNEVLQKLNTKKLTANQLSEVCFHNETYKHTCKPLMA